MSRRAWPSASADAGWNRIPAVLLAGGGIAAARCSAKSYHVWQMLMTYVADSAHCSSLNVAQGNGMSSPKSRIYRSTHDRCYVKHEKFLLTSRVTVTSIASTFQSSARSR